MNASPNSGRGLVSALLACPATPTSLAHAAPARYAAAPEAGRAAAPAPVLAGRGGDVRPQTDGIGLFGAGARKRPQSEPMVLVPFDQTHPGVTRRPPA